MSRESPLPDQRLPAGEPHLRTAYLMSRYPAVSHTFFLQEVAGLRERGCQIETASINLSDRPAEELSGQERQEQTRTFYVKGQSHARVLLQMVRIALNRPKVAWRGLRVALQLQPGHLFHTLYALFYLAEALLVGDWMQRKQLAHLHIHFSGPVASVGMLTGLAWRIPYSMTVHGPDEFFDQGEMALKQKTENAAFVVCISEFCRSQLMRILPPDQWDKLRVVRLGIQPNLVDLLHEPGSTQTTRILCTGRLVGAKGQAILLMAVAELVRRGQCLAVTLIGDGVDRQVLEAWVDEHGLRTNVFFAGAQSHAYVLERLRSSDIFVLPSFAEGVPVALMEAMAIGVPCISTFIAGIPELIRHEQDGLLVPAGSVDDLTAAIERLITNSNERERFRDSAREQVLTHYNLPANLETLAAILTELAPHALRSSHGS